MTFHWLPWSRYRDGLRVNWTRHPALAHLQFSFTVAEYEALLQKYTRGVFGPDEMAADYWERLPRYVTGRCPLCGATNTETLDTHALTRIWSTEPDSFRSVFRAYAPPQIGCRHFVAVQTFVNLNGTPPTELSYYWSMLDVPFVMPTFVPDDVPAVAVLHSLPICRIENGAFVPRYAVYMITYFAPEPAILWQRRRTVNLACGQRDPDYDGTVLFTSAEAEGQPEAWDLRLWVARGKLQWLDPSTDDLALKAGPPAEVPYADVQGYRRSFTIRDGKLKLGL